MGISGSSQEVDSYPPGVHVGGDVCRLDFVNQVAGKFSTCVLVRLIETIEKGNQLEGKTFRQALARNLQGAFRIPNRGLVGDLLFQIALVGQVIISIHRVRRWQARGPQHVQRELRIAPGHLAQKLLTHRERGVILVQALLLIARWTFRR